MFELLCSLEKALFLLKRPLLICDRRQVSGTCFQAPATRLPIQCRLTPSRVPVRNKQQPLPLYLIDPDSKHINNGSEKNQGTLLPIASKSHWILRTFQHSVIESLYLML